MRWLTVLCAYMCTSCMMGMIIEQRRAEALRAAKFDTGCEHMAVEAEQLESTTIRYRIVGCQKRYVYLCDNAGHRDVMVTGSYSVEGRCVKLAQ